MKFISHFLLFLILVTSLTACKQKAVSLNEHFKGFWRGYGNQNTMATLEISNDSYGKYKETPNWSEGGHGHVNGMARIEGQLLKIGPYTKFKILEFPIQIDTSMSEFTVLEKKANWRMKLELPDRFLSSGYFYMADY